MLPRSSGQSVAGFLFLTLVTLIVSSDMRCRGESGNDDYGARTPEKASSAQSSRTTGILEQIKAHNALWLAPDEASFPELSYTLEIYGRPHRFSFDHMPELAFRRGTLLETGLERPVGQPDKFIVRKRYEGMLNGREVLIADVIGDSNSSAYMPLVFDAGLGGWHYGHVSVGVSRAVLVIEKETWRPLVALYPEFQVSFLNYVEAQPGQHVPLRIVPSGEGRFLWDFRFQLLDDRVWLLDRHIGDGGETTNRIVDVKLDGVAPRKTRRAENVASMREIGEFSLNTITDLRGQTPEEQLLAGLFERNRPWLYPTLDHLDNVAFTHYVEAPRLEEHFAWRRDGTSLIEVTANEDRQTSSNVGSWWLTTCEPGYYYRAAKEKLVHREHVRHEDPGSSFYPVYFRKYLMGAPLDFVLLEWARRPHCLAVESIAKEPGENLWRISVGPLSLQHGPWPELNVGSVFHSASWPLSRSATNYRRTDLYVESETFRPVRETDSGHEKMWEVTFSDYQDVGRGRSGPRRIHVRVAGELEADYRFQWRSEGLWILQSAVSRTWSVDGKPRVEGIRDLKINQRKPAALDKALAALETYRRYMESPLPSSQRTVNALPFVLGKAVEFSEPPFGKGEVEIRRILFTFDHAGRLIAKSTLNRTAGKKPVEGVFSVVLLDGEDRPVSANSAHFRLGHDDLTTGTIFHFGHVATVGDTKYFSVGLATRSDSQPMRAVAGSKQVSLPVYSFAVGREMAINATDTVKKQVSAKQALFKQDRKRDLICRLELVSQDQWQITELASPVILLSDQGAILAAGHEVTTFTLYDRNELKPVTVNFGQVPDIRAVKYFHVATSRAPTLSDFDGSMFLSYHRDPHPPFSIDQLLGADDGRVCKAGVKKLQAKVRRENAGTTASVSALERLLATQQDSEILSLACRLLGRSGEKRLIGRIRPLLNDPRDSVKDGAAVGLGMLGDETGFERLPPILDQYTSPGVRGVPEETRDWQQDAVLALQNIGTPKATRELGNLLLRTVATVHIVPYDGRYGNVAGPFHLVRLLLGAMGQLRTPMAREFLERALKLCAESKDAIREADVVETLALFKEQAHAIFAKELRRGNLYVAEEVAKTSDSFYVPYVREMLGQTKTEEWAFKKGVEYLVHLRSTEAVGALKEVHDLNLHPEYAEARKRMRFVLEAHGEIEMAPGAQLDKDLADDFKYLWSDDENVQAEISEALKKWGYPSYFPECVTGTLRGKDPKEREACASNLAWAKHPHIVPALILALRAENSDVRTRAAEVLGQIGDKRAIEPLGEVLQNDKNPKVRRAAERALRRLDAAGAVNLLPAIP
jgi:HEAT repeat protein